VPFQAQFQVPLHVGPFASQDTVHMGIPGGPVATVHVVTDDAVQLCAQRSNRLLRRKIEIVGPKSHHLAPRRLESRRKQKKFARGVDNAQFGSAAILR
jgi:hypothetical protein